MNIDCFLVLIKVVKVIFNATEIFEYGLCIRSVQFSRSVVSDSLQPHELQHARPPYLSPAPGVHTNSCPSSQWCHPAISSSVVPFSSCPQSLPASESLTMSQLFAWCGQSTGVSASASFLPKNTQDWSPLEWTCWISIRELPWIFLSLIMRLCHWDHLIVLQDKNTRIHNKKIVIVDSPIYYWITMLYNRI